MPKHVVRAPKLWHSPTAKEAYYGDMDQIEQTKCKCGWPRPLIAITRTDGRLPEETLSVRYDCPQCGRVHVTGELMLSKVQHSSRARKLVRG
jgi:predicted RNA-binding Zn-ribbon protein involved in translation (DUF1610 family)